MAMQSPTQSSTSTITLKQVIDRLKLHPAVDGILLVGTTDSDMLTPISDYDILIVLSEMPVPLHVGYTYIDNRLTDLLFATVNEVDRIITEKQQFKPFTYLLSVTRWLQTGNIVFDRTDRLHRAKDILQNKILAVPPSEYDRYGICFGLNFDYRHNHRMAESDDPIYQTALDLRFCFTINNLFWGYFSLRDILWEGEKKAVRYLEIHNPEFLKLVRQCLAETDRKVKFKLLENLAEIVTAPAGGLWTGKPTAIATKDEGKPTPADIEKAALFWEQLVGNAS
ncbi:MAG TPA: hypothetical protein DDW31_04475 [candidate division Zixibacteria bacterium]|nr:hypothetical protein [candidate division Zixibacteria bacterium]